MWQRLEKENKMNIEMNKFYMTTDILHIFGISERTYYRRQTEFNQYLDLYFKYQTWNDGVRNWYIFFEQYEEEIPTFKHKRKVNKADNNEAIYTDIIDKEIKRNPLFNANSLSNDLFATGVLPAEHSIRTARRYIMNILKSDKYATLNPVWCKKVWNDEIKRIEYQPMGEEEVEEYKALIRSLANGKGDLELTLNYYEGHIPPDEYYKKHNELWNAVFKEAKDTFYKKYNYTPRSIKPIAIGAF